MENETANTVEVSRVRTLYATGEARTLRTEAALSLADVARTAGVDRSTVSRWETGKTRPSRTEALRVAALLSALKKADA